MALILLVMLIGPLGAPLIGMSISSACNIPWEGPYECAFPEPFQSYFVTLFVVAFFPFGPTLGWLWMALSLGLLTALIWYAGRAMWEAVSRLR